MFKNYFKKNDNKAESDSKHPFGFWFALAALLIAVDQSTKFIASRKPEYVFLNDNFAFSIPLPALLMYAIYIVVLAAIAKYLHSSWNGISNSDKISWTFILAGGLSNISERIILGHVRDFIPVLSGILNVADLYIIFGLVLLLITGRKNFR
jgi:lipoprotein signal peptidase